MLTKLYCHILARRHQGPPPSDEGVIISEEEFDAQSKENVRRWVSAHIIPVCFHDAVIAIGRRLMDVFQQSPIAMSSGSYATLLDGISVSVEVVKGKDDAPEWSRVVLNGRTHIVSAKEVRIFANNLTPLSLIRYSRTRLPMVYST